MEFILEKQENRLWRNTKAFEQYKKDLPPGRYIIKIENEDKRTPQQNRWIHAVLPDILMGLRNKGFGEVKTTEDAKDVVKGLFFKDKVSNGIETIEVVKGTSKTSKLDFTAKADEIIKWAAEWLEIDIAPPEKQLEVFENNEYDRGNE